MSEELKHKIYSPGNCVSEQTMFDYIDNKLRQRERHEVEKHLLDCELCSDAMDGLDLLKNRKYIAEINDAVDARMEATTQKAETKISSFNYKLIISVAAALIILIGAVFLFSKFTDENKYVSEMKTTKNISSVPLKTANTPPDSEYSKSRTDAKEQEPLMKVKQNAASPASLQDVLPEKDTINEPEMIPPATPVMAETTTSGGGNGQLAERNEMIADKINALPKKETGGNNAERSRAQQKNKITDAKKDLSGFVYSSAESKQTAIDEDLIIQTRPDTLADSAYTVPDEMPVFPGGNDSLLAFIHKHYKLSADSKDKVMASKKTIVQFIIDKNGFIKNPKIITGINPESDKEVLKMISLMPAWIPGKQNGKFISTRYILPIQLEGVK